MKPCCPSIGAILKSIRAYLTKHPKSPALLVAQHVWGELCPATRDVHVDSWVWIRERMEELAQAGELRCEGAVWSLAVDTVRR
jgi:hypothetical protein